MKHTHNPAELGLTHAENKVYTIILTLTHENKVISSGDILKRYGNKNRMHIYTVVKKLTSMGLVERYNRNFIRIKKDEK